MSYRKMHIRPATYLLTLVFFLSGCASVPELGPREPSYALDNTASTAISRALAEDQAAHPGLSAFYPLADGLDAFVARAVLADASEKSIDAQYYLYHNDLVGKLFTSLLVNAANRGVRVRLLVDDMAIDNGDAGAIKIDAHPNIEVRIFNPFFRNAPRTAQLIARFGKVTRRMHNKSFIVDNQIAVLGGRNIGNEYFNADKNLIFGDLDVIAKGPIVTDVSASFDQYWNHQLAYPIDSFVEEAPDESLVGTLREEVKQFSEEQADSAYLTALRHSDLATSLRVQGIEYFWGNGAVVSDDPDKINSDRNRTDLHLVDELQQYTSQIQDDLIIFSPYFVPGKKGVAWLESLRDRGVRVRILTNSLASTDVSVVHAGYSRYRKALLRAGVELWEYDDQLTRKQRKEIKGVSGSSQASLHAKSFVLDKQRVFIGSLNLDPRSISENTEIGVVIESKEMALEMASSFEQKIDEIAFRLSLQPNAFGRDKIVWHRLQEGTSRIYTSEPNSSLWRRFTTRILRWMPIESQI